MVERRRSEPNYSFDIELEDFVDDFTHCFTGECRVNVLPVLFQVSQVLTESEDIAAALPLILDVMQQRLKIARGMVTLYDVHSETIFIHESFGLTDDQKARGIYSLGEGITGKVVELGKTIIVPRLSENPEAAGGEAHGAHPSNAFFCVPIRHAKKVLGTISAERVYLNRRLLKLDVELIATIASMIAPAMELYLAENAVTVQLKTENQRLHNALKARFRPSNIIGSSKPMQEVYELIHRVANTKATVLVLGESGVGKELVANAIHYNSASAEGPFVKFNCAALPDNLVESELFGHEKGAFTGATNARKGRFELADGGTVFLDEVGELNLALQAKLLRVLQEKTFDRVGGTRPVQVDLRIIAATNRDLLAMVKKGEFREDLYYRLNVFPITIPPLRERGSDVILLADHFVARAGADAARDIKRISTAALNMMMAYHWPGNVRELENVIERSVILSEDGVIHAYDLPPSLQTPSESGTVLGCGLDAKLEAVEYEMIIEALKQHKGNTTEAAKELGITRRVLGLRMARHGIVYKSFRRTA
jgi:Nif-specific regulatory protein